MPSKTSTPKSLRYPSFLMYEEDIAARRVVMPYWKKRMGPKFSFADVLRRLVREESRIIRAEGVSKIAV